MKSFRMQKLFTELLSENIKVRKKNFKLLVLEFLKKTKKKFQIVSFGVS